MKRTVPVSCDVCRLDMLAETTIEGDMKVSTLSCPDPDCANPGVIETFTRELVHVHLCGPGFTKTGAVAVLPVWALVKH
jgi:hypothetical protein